MSLFYRMPPRMVRADMSDFLRRPTGLAGICAGAAAVQVMAAAVAFTFLGKLGLMFEEMKRAMPAATRFLVQGHGAPVWGILLAMGLALALAAGFGSNRMRSVAILVTAVVSGALGLAVPLIALWPLRG